MNVLEMAEEYLESHGFDGIVCTTQTGWCLNGNFGSCFNESCLAAVKVLAEDFTDELMVQYQGHDYVLMTPENRKATFKIREKESEAFDEALNSISLKMTSVGDMDGWELFKKMLEHISYKSMTFNSNDDFITITFNNNHKRYFDDIRIESLAYEGIEYYNAVLIRRGETQLAGSLYNKLMCEKRLIEEKE